MIKHRDTLNAWLDGAEAALTAAGYQIVPVVPTEAMLKASSRGDARRAGFYYRRMLKASKEEQT